MSYQIKTDLQKNRLYLILGVMDKEEISRFCDDAGKAVNTLERGFSCITDLRSLMIPVESIEKKDIEKILQIHRLLREKGVSGIVRVAESQIWLAAALAESEMVTGLHIAYAENMEKAETCLDAGLNIWESKFVRTVHADTGKNRLYISFNKLATPDFNTIGSLILLEASKLKPYFGCILDLRYLRIDWSGITVQTIGSVRKIQTGLKKIGLGMVVRIVNNSFWLDNIADRNVLDPETWVQLTLGEGQLDAGYKATFASNPAEAEILLDETKLIDGSLKT